jgi:hypothetical protein
MPHNANIMNMSKVFLDAASLLRLIPTPFLRTLVWPLLFLFVILIRLRPCENFLLNNFINLLLNLLVAWMANKKCMLYGVTLFDRNPIS